MQKAAGGYNRGHPDGRRKNKILLTISIDNILILVYNMIVRREHLTIPPKREKGEQWKT